MGINVGILFEDLDLLGILDQLKPMLRNSDDRQDNDGQYPAIKPENYNIYLDFQNGSVSHSLGIVEKNASDVIPHIGMLQYTADRASEDSLFVVEGRAYIGNDDRRTQLTQIRHPRQSGVMTDISFTYKPYTILWSGKSTSGTVSKSVVDRAEKEAGSQWWLYKRMIGLSLSPYETQNDLSFHRHEAGLWVQQSYEIMPEIGSMITFPCNVVALEKQVDEATTRDAMQTALVGVVYLQTPFSNLTYVKDGVAIQNGPISVYRPYWDSTDHPAQFNSILTELLTNRTTDQAVTNRLLEELKVFKSQVLAAQ